MITWKGGKWKVHPQGPDVDSPRSFCKKVLSTSVAEFLRRLLDFSFWTWSTFSRTTNRGSTPGSVGKKNGAFSSGFGGSFGLFRCYKRVR